MFNYLSRCQEVKIALKDSLYRNDSSEWIVDEIGGLGFVAIPPHSSKLFLKNTINEKIQKLEEHIRSLSESSSQEGEMSLQKKRACEKLKLLVGAEKKFRAIKYPPFNTINYIGITSLNTMIHNAEIYEESCVNSLFYSTCTFSVGRKSE